MAGATLQTGGGVSICGGGSSTPHQQLRRHSSCHLPLLLRLRYIWVLASSLACWLSALCAGLIYCLAAAALISIEAHSPHPQAPCAAVCVCHECVAVQAINLHALLLVRASLRCCRATICLSIVAVLYELVCMDNHTLDDMRPCSAVCLAQSHSTASGVSVLSQPLSVSSLWQLCSCTATCLLKQTAGIPWVCCCQAQQQLQQQVAIAMKSAALQPCYWTDSLVETHPMLFADAAAVVLLSGIGIGRG